MAQGRSSGSNDYIVKIFSFSLGYSIKPNKVHLMAHKSEFFCGSRGGMGGGSQNKLWST